MTKRTVATEASLSEAKRIAHVATERAALRLVRKVGETDRAAHELIARLDKEKSAVAALKSFLRGENTGLPHPPRKSKFAREHP